MPEDYVLESYPSAVVQAEQARPLGTPASTCVVCKGRQMCGMAPCPLLGSIRTTYTNIAPCGEETDSLALEITLGADTFPHDPVGMTLGAKDLFSASGREEALGIVGGWYYASSGPEGAHDLSLHDIAMSERPVGVSVRWDELPQGKVRYSASELPQGRQGTIAALELLDDPVIPSCIPGLLGGEGTAEQAMEKGFSCGLSPEYLARLHALGMFGSPPWQMPSQWALSSAYNICSRSAIHECKSFEIVSEPKVYTSEHLGERIAVALLPRPWEFELIEAWRPNTLWTLGETADIIVNEHETYRGVSDQALREGGSYFSSRMGVASLLQREKVQAAALVVRSPEPQSSVPLGSALIAETIRRAQEAGTFGTEEEAVRAACSFVGADEKSVLRQSMTMQQDTLSRWF